MKGGHIVSQTRLFQSNLLLRLIGSTFDEEARGQMKAKVLFAVLVAGAALATMMALVHLPIPAPNPGSEHLDSSLVSRAPDSPPQVTVSEPVAPPQPAIHAASQSLDTPTLLETPVATNKLERLAQIRKGFRTLAAGDHIAALRAARQVTDETERETALLTLVTEWTQGELRPPRERARSIDNYGLEAGLGMELARNPELAVTWANELTDGPGRAAVLQQTAIALAGSDPVAGFGLSAQLSEGDRRGFFDAVFAGWAAKDTEAALQWADQLPDPAQRDSAIRAIRTAAPVGIGAALSVQDGYPVVHDLIPGGPAELSGQIHPGDRILALAQGDNAFVDARGLSLQDFVQMVRGMPGTPVQLQVLPADAPADSQPRTISVTRAQIKFKQ